MFDAFSNSFVRLSAYAVPVVLALASLAAYTNIATDQVNNGFALKSSHHFPDLNATGHLYEHKKHGSQFVHFETNDNHKFFAVAFKTPPIDDSGSTHVLEHLVLHGSERYPINSVFTELMKRSVSTFMNAFTSIEWTGYPFSSTNDKDFLNVLNVYLDSAFHPRLTPISFKSECHHLEFEDLDNISSNLRHSGVVYNEMNGDYSKPSSRFAQLIFRNLYPNASFRYEYGGYPPEIANLTLQRVKEQHSRYYHPSNARFFYYGDMSVDEVLNRVNKVISPFKHSKVEIPDEALTQPKWNEPRFVNETGPAEDDPTKVRQGVSWMVGDLRNQSDIFDLSFLSSLLLDSSLSPLYVGLVKSGFGSRFISSGFGADTRSPMFTIGLEGVDPNTNLTEKVYEIFENVTRDGFDKDRITALLHQIEMNQLEVGSNTGLDLWMGLIGSWIHDVNVFDIIDTRWEVSRVKTILKMQPRYFEMLLKSRIMQNTHRLDLIVNGRSDYQELIAKETASELAAFQATLTDDEKMEYVKLAHEIKESVDAPKPLEKLPSIKLDDLNRTSPRKQCAKNDGVFEFERPTNGLVYIRLLQEIPLDSDLEILPELVNVLPFIGAGNLEEERFTKEVQLKTGGVSVGLSKFMESEDNMKLYMLISASCLPEDVDATVDILKQLCNEPHFNNTKRIMQRLKEKVGRFKDSIAEGGHRYAIYYATSKFSKSNALDELQNGIHYYRTIKKVIEMDPDEVSKRLEAAFRSFGQARASVHAPPGQTAVVASKLRTLLKSVNDRKQIRQQLNQLDTIMTEMKDITKVHLEVDSTTYFCSVAFEGPYYRTPKFATRMLSTEIVRTEYLHDLIREKLGAYGVIGHVSPSSGATGFISYRDTSPAAVLEAFDAALKDAAENVTQEMLERAVMHTVAGLDQPIAPKDSCGGRFNADSCDYNYAEEIRERVFQTTLEEIKADIREMIAAEKVSVIVGGKGKVPDGFERLQVFEQQ